MQRRIFITIIICLIFITLAIAQQPGEISYHDESVRPGGKEGERIQSLIDTFNSHDPISKYVDESWLTQEMTSKITIHHLLSHTSGLGSYFNEKFAKGSRAQWRSVDDFKPLVMTSHSPTYFLNISWFSLGAIIFM